MDLHETQLRVRLKRYIARLMRKPEDVEDLVQDSYLRIIEAGSRGEITHPRAYLYRIAHNLALNSAARKSNTVVDYIEDLLGADDQLGSASLEEEVMAQESFEMFCRAVAELPEQCRKVLVLRKVYGYSQQDVADSLGISISTVEKHLAKGALRCHLYMEEHGYGREAAPLVRTKR
jgi:RNA polymerase sigma-70 factor (ECF subfamily)